MLEYSHTRNCPFCNHVFSVKVTAAKPEILEERVMEWADDVAIHMQNCFVGKEYAKSVKKN